MDAFRLLLPLFCISNLLAYACAWNHREKFPSALKGLESSSKEFDYFVLALQWPGAVCKSKTHCCSSNGCCNGALNSLRFTIHGLWPDYSDGSWPQCCDGPEYNETKIASLFQDLEKYWPSLSCSKPTNCHGKKGSFWEHEWEKHGTCAYPVIRDEYSYFATGLQLRSEYNVLDMLKEAGFSPNNDVAYRTDSIISAISKATGATPLLSCSHGAVKEIKLCLDKKFKTRDCVGHNSCPHEILLPSYQTSVENYQGATKLVSWIIQLYRKMLGFGSEQVYDEAI